MLEKKDERDQTFVRESQNENHEKNEKKANGKEIFYEIMKKLT